MVSRAGVSADMVMVHAADALSLIHISLQGINKVENVEGEFSLTQDKVQNMDELYSYDFVHGYYDHMRYACSPVSYTHLLLVYGWRFC